MRRTLLISTLLALLAAGCSDDTVAADSGTDQGLADMAQGDTAQADATQADSTQADATQADMTQADMTQADMTQAADSGATTTCGTLTCNNASEVCVITQQQIGPKYECQSVPSGCESDRSCSCLGAQVCQSPYVTCSDGTAANTVSCSCLNC